MKKKVLLSSILTIALCLCLIAGSTFALFTSTSKVDISVKAANVEMRASLDNFKLFSVTPTKNGSIQDEQGGTYEYVEMRPNNNQETTFLNGGTVTFDDATSKLVLDRITPGDKVSFDITGANKSDVTIQYRYIIECVSGEKLMSGLLVTIGDTTYPILSSYTSAWQILTPNNDISAVPVVIELPVYAGNEYQRQTTEIKVTVEAVQGNANVVGFKPAVEFLDGYTGKLNEEVLNDSIVNRGDVTLEGGTIVLDSVAVENYGDLTLNDMVIDGGTPGTIAYGYAIVSREDSKTDLDNVIVATCNGGIAAVDGAKIIFQDGSVVINSNNTSPRYNFYAQGEGSEITINSGTFAFEQYRQRSYVCAIDGAVVTINGGVFGVAPNHTRWKTPINTSNGGTVIIKGGTFGFDPTTWVADGYTAVKNGSTWIVVPGDDGIVVSDSQSLQAALESATGNYTIVLTDDVVGDVVVPQKAGVEILIEGNGHILDGVILVDGKSATITSAGITIQNVVFKADRISADACIRLGDGTNATRYACNVSIIGCTFDVPGAVGVKSYTGGDKNVVIKDCVATEVAHSLAQLKGVDGVLVENCKVNSIRGINLNNSLNVTINNSTFNVQKYAVRFGESENTTVENFAITNSTLVSQCLEGDAVVVLRKGATNANLNLAGTTLEGPIEISGHENANITR